MDVQMPVMDGGAASQAIRDREKITGMRLPIIALTAHALNGDKERFLAAGLDDYVAKPLKLDELVSAIDRQLGKNRCSKQSLNVKFFAGWLNPDSKWRSSSLQTAGSTCLKKHL